MSPMYDTWEPVDNETANIYQCLSEGLYAYKILLNFTNQNYPFIGSLHISTICVSGPLFIALCPSYTPHQPDVQS